MSKLQKTQKLNILWFTGIAGFRGAASNMWVDEKCGDGQRISGWSDPSVIKSNNPSEACRKCQGVVYDLESHHSKAGIYHKVCFKCDSCQKNLDSLSAQYLETQLDNGLFCHRCFEEKFGSITSAPNIYSETAKIIAVDEKGCPRCGGAVFHAEEIIEGGNTYHRKCFSCKTCKKNIASRRQGENFVSCLKIFFLFWEVS